MSHAFVIFATVNINTKIKLLNSIFEEKQNFLYMNHFWFPGTDFKEISLQEIYTTGSSQKLTQKLSLSLYYFLIHSTLISKKVQGLKQFYYVILSSFGH